MTLHSLTNVCGYVTHCLMIFDTLRPEYVCNFHVNFDDIHIDEHDAVTVAILNMTLHSLTNVCGYVTHCLMIFDTLRPEYVCNFHVNFDDIHTDNHDAVTVAILYMTLHSLTNVCGYVTHCLMIFDTLRPEYVCNFHVNFDDIHTDNHDAVTVAILNMTLHSLTNVCGYVTHCLMIFDTLRPEYVSNFHVNFDDIHTDNHDAVTVAILYMTLHSLTNVCGYVTHCLMIFDTLRPEYVSNFYVNFDNIHIDKHDNARVVILNVILHSLTEVCRYVPYCLIILTLRP